MGGASIRRRCWPLIGYWVLVPFVLAGCGGPGSATVEGKVTVDGQPISAGRVFFRSLDGKNTTVAAIEGDGSYHAVDVPCEAMRITVTLPSKFERIRLQRWTNSAKAKGPNAPGAPAKSGAAETIESSVKIPEKYQDPDASGLMLTVKRGANIYNIEILSE